MPFDAITTRPDHSGADILWTGTAADMRAIGMTKRRCDWQIEVFRLTGLVNEQRRRIGHAQRRLGELRFMGRHTSLDRMCLEIATRGSYCTRRDAFVSLNRFRGALRRAEKKLQAALIHGYA